MSERKEFLGYRYDSPASVDLLETQAKLAQTLEIMRPKPCPFRLLRIGGNGDGAYLVPDDLDNVRVCFSPGVANRKDFEDRLTVDYGVTCHMCDFTSDEGQLATPLISGKQTFDKLWLEPDGAQDRIDLKSWIESYYPDGCGDMMLQMDIEGAEYRNILATDVGTLALFRIIVLEVHQLGALNSAPLLNGVLHPFFSKIGSLFTCVHIHPNNYSDEISIPNSQINLAEVVELTFVRTDVSERLAARGLNPVMTPHPLDIVNAAQIAPIVLSEFWCGGARAIESRMKIVEDELAFQRIKYRQLAEDLNKSVAVAFRLALSGAVLKCVSLSEEQTQAKGFLAPFEDVAVRRRYQLSSEYGGIGRGGLVAASKDAYFFHTNCGMNESITVDLGAPRELRALLIVNRRDACFSRAAVLYLTLGPDPDLDLRGQGFYLGVPQGFADGNSPHMLAGLPSVRARFVRVSSPLYTYLHFAELRVYALVDS